MLGSVYFAVLIAASVMMLLLVVYGVQQRQTHGSILFAALIGVATGWPLATAISMAVPQSQAGFYYETIRYDFIALIPVFFLLFILRYLGQEKWLTLPRALPFFIIPAITIILNLTNGSHHLFIEEFSYQQIDGFNFPLENAYGPWYFVHSIYSYLLLMVGMILVMVRWARAQGAYQGQLGWLLLGSLIPATTNLLDVFELIPGYPLTPPGFAIMAGMFAVALFRFRLLDLMPVARDAIIESMDDLVLVLDTQNRIVDVNPALEKRVGQPAARMLGQPVREVFADQPELLDRYSGVGEAHDEVPLYGAVYDFTLTTLYERRGEAVGRLFVLRDITERKQAEKEREQLIGELNAYAHMVAHDLKNPLGIILSAVQLYYEAPPENHNKYLDMIERSGKRSIGIIDELLLLASIRKQADVPITRVNMAEVVNNGLERLQHHIDGANARISIPGQWPAVQGHAPWVEEVWVNYISNAIKYGGEPPLVELGAQARENGMIRFYVRDNGSGLTAEECSKLFAEFSRLDQVRTEGHGLGLSIVKRIVTRLKGEVGVESTPGVGSTFWFTLPAAKEQQAASQSA